MLRPSTSTSNLLAKRSLKPRALIAQRFEEMRATWMPGTMRSASGIEVTPERMISSPVTT